MLNDRDGNFACPLEYQIFLGKYKLYIFWCTVCLKVTHPNVWQGLSKKEKGDLFLLEMRMNFAFKGGWLEKFLVEIVCDKENL